jgi:hypothetical protein
MVGIVKPCKYVELKVERSCGGVCKKYPDEIPPHPEKPPRDDAIEIGEKSVARTVTMELCGDVLRNQWLSPMFVYSLYH